MGKIHGQLLKLLRELFDEPSLTLEEGLNLFVDRKEIYFKTLLAYVQLYSEHGFPPTVRELSAVLEPESTAVQARINRLRAWGLLDYMILDTGKAGARTTRPSELGRLLLSLADKLESES